MSVVFTVQASIYKLIYGLTPLSFRNNHLTLLFFYLFNNSTMKQVNCRMIGNLVYHIETDVR